MLILVENSNGARSTAMYWLDEDMTWETVPDEMQEARINHCQVQINDCEIAFIGGIRGTTYDGYENGNSDLDYDSSTDDDMVIDIYNHQTNTWRTGPK